MNWGITRSGQFKHLGIYVTLGSVMLHKVDPMEPGKSIQGERFLGRGATGGALTVAFIDNVAGLLSPDAATIALVIGSDNHYFE